ncbi:MAG TPA: FHA domain-containing protein [Planctomycetota bacterium]|nr:FHA domain-containing protein [Planctomycetota bacterium]
MSVFFLLVRDGGREPAVRIEARPGLDIGRSPDCQCVLKDGNVGRKAARVVEERGVYYVEDSGSVNRTNVRGGKKLEKGERERLRHGMVIEVGRSSIEIEEQRTSLDDATDAGDRTDPGDDLMGDQTLVAGLSGDDLGGLRTMVEQKPPAPPAPRVPPQREPAPRPSVPRSVEPPPAARPVPAASAARTPEPVRPQSTADFMGQSGSGTQSILPISGDLGALGTMITRRPRLVIVNEADRRVVPLERMVTTVGRESGECRIDHQAISQPHAAIQFVSKVNNFQIEDLKSRNQTFVGGVVLNPGVSQLLAPECLVRFGPIEAVFVVDRDDENAEIPAAQYAGAVRSLLAQNLISPAQAKAAQEEAKPGGKHVGEVLLLSGVIGARAWTKAFASGSSLQPAAVTLQSGRRAWILMLAFVVAALILAFVFRAKLGF